MIFTQNLVRKKYPVESSNVQFDAGKKENSKPLNIIAIGTKAKLWFSDSTFLPDEKQTKFRRDYLNFDVTAVQHFQRNFSLMFLLLNMLSIFILKNVTYHVLQAQYLTSSYQFVLHTITVSNLFSLSTHQ